MHVALQRAGCVAWGIKKQSPTKLGCVLQSTLIHEVTAKLHSKPHLSARSLKFAPSTDLCKAVRDEMHWKPLIEKRIGIK